MFTNLQQDNASAGNAAAAVVDAGRSIPVIANIALLLALLIIPPLDGVFLIA